MSSARACIWSGHWCHRERKKKKKKTRHIIYRLAYQVLYWHSQSPRLPDGLSAGCTTVPGTGLWPSSSRSLGSGEGPQEPPQLPGVPAWSPWRRGRNLQENHLPLYIRPLSEMHGSRELSKAVTLSTLNEASFPSPDAALQVELGHGCAQHRCIGVPCTLTYHHNYPCKALTVHILKNSADAAGTQ